jgi:LPXTG-site transpeptidase (sortase) family protein
MVRLNRAWAVVALVAGLVLLVVGLVLIRQPHATTGARRLPAPDHIISDTGTPLAVPSPSRSLPDGVRIKVPELGIDLPLVEGDGWNAPLFKAALYPTLKVPGQGGRSMIYAHARVGMFDPLFRARVGQAIEIDEPDGKVLHYKITEYYPRWSSTDLKWLMPLDQEQIILVTCTTYNPNDPRVIVVAQPA